MLLTSSSHKDAYGPHRFVEKFKSREAKFIHHATKVVVFASVAFYRVQAKPPNSQSLETPVPVKNETLKTDIQTWINTLPSDDRKAFREATDIKIRELPSVKSVQKCVKDFLVSIGTSISDDPYLLGVGGLNYILTVSTLKLPY